MRKALRRLLATHDFRVEDYENGKDFLTELPSHPAHCVVLDLHMPGVNGFDVLAALKSRPVAPPIVVVTGHDEPGTAERTRALGVSEYLKKPVDELALLAAIRAAIAAGSSNR